MPEFGFPAQPRQALLNRIIADLRSRGDEARVAAVTGRFADIATERQGRVEELMQIEKSITDLRGYGEAIALSEGRANTMQESLAAIVANAQGLADTATLLQTNATDRDFESVSAEARQTLDSVVASLNQQFAGRTLFAGDDADGAAVADAATVFADTVATLEAGPTVTASLANLQTDFFGAGGLFDTTYYQGGAGAAPMTEVAVGERIDYTVKADETPFRRVLMEMSVLAASFDRANAIPDDQRRDLLAQAADGLRTAVAEIVTVQGRLGAAEARIATVKSRNIASEAALTLQFNDLAGADQFDATLRLTELDSQLETALQTTVRLSNLSIANFL